jgi:hypothetical protein
LGEFLPFGRLFTLSRFSKIPEVAHIVGLLLSTVIVAHEFCHKNGFCYILGDFSQTHLVTLLPTEQLDYALTLLRRKVEFKLWDAAELDIWICFLSVSVLHFVVGCVGVF